MFFILSKILFYLVMPFTWILVASIIAVFTKKEVHRKRALLTTAVLLLIFTNPFLNNEVWLWWEEAPKPIATLPQYDAAIVLTGFTNLNKSPHDRVYTNKGAERVLHAIQLYKQGKVRQIIISGGSGSLLKKHASEAAEVQQILLQAGVPAGAILLEDKSRNTHENAQNTKHLLTQHPQLNKLLLITSAFHMRRAKGCFQKEGIHINTFSTDFYTTDRSWSPDGLIIPQVACLVQWQKLFHEMTGYLTYKVMGYC